MKGGVSCQTTWIKQGIFCDLHPEKPERVREPAHLMIRWSTERRAVLAVARDLPEKGLVVGSAGNVSMRIPGQKMLAITPSRKPYSDLEEDDIQIIDFDANPVEGDAIPSVESLIHIGVYQARPDVGAVVHTHSTYASALAVAHRSLPPVIDEMVTSLGGEIAVTSYAFPSTEDLADQVVESLADRNAVLLANHGVVGLGKEPRDALSACELVERAAKIYTIATLLGGAHSLPTDIIDTEIALFKMMRAASQGDETP